jgi:hypothetical protein
VQTRHPAEEGIWIAVINGLYMKDRKCRRPIGEFMLCWKTKNDLKSLDYLFRNTSISDTNLNTMIEVARLYSVRYGKNNVCRYREFSNAVDFLSESASRIKAAPYVEDDLKAIVCSA